MNTRLRQNLPPRASPRCKTESATRASLKTEMDKFTEIDAFCPEEAPIPHEGHNRSTPTIVKYLRANRGSRIAELHRDSGTGRRVPQVLAAYRGPICG